MARARVLDLRQKVKSKHARPWAVRWSVRRAGRRTFHEQRFRTQVEALRFCDDLNVKLARGHHPQVRDGRRLFEEYALQWLACLHDVAPRTRQGYETLFRVHVLPTFGGRQLRDIRRSDCEAYVRALRAKGLAPPTITATRVDRIGKESNRLADTQELVNGEDDRPVVYGRNRCRGCEQPVHGRKQWSSEACRKRTGRVTLHGP